VREGGGDVADTGKQAGGDARSDYGRRDEDIMGVLWARRRLIFTLALCILVALLAVVVISPLWHSAPPSTTVGQASTTTPVPTATWHPTYSIVFEGLFTTTARRGGQLTYRWSPQLDAMPRSPGRSTFTCTFGLYGPFSSQTDAEHASQTDLSAVTLSLAAAPVTLDSWTSEPHPGTLTLPENLALGYYVAIGRAVESDGGTRTDIRVIRIVG
jgi:hypothetical protein